MGIDFEAALKCLAFLITRFDKQLSHLRIPSIVIIREFRRNKVNIKFSTRLYGLVRWTDNEENLGGYCRKDRDRFCFNKFLLSWFGLPNSLEGTWFDEKHSRVQAYTWFWKNVPISNEKVFLDFINFWCFLRIFDVHCKKFSINSPWKLQPGFFLTLSSVCPHLVLTMSQFCLTFVHTLFLLCPKFVFSLSFFRS